MPVSKKKIDALKQKMAELGIKESDLEEKFILGSGKGGQKLHKTSSCVYLKHLPTKIAIKCQAERSRAFNRFLARRYLCERIEENVYQIKTKKRQLAEKIRRQKKRRSRKQKEKMLEEKRKHSEKKSLRHPPNVED